MAACGVLATFLLAAPAEALEPQASTAGAAEGPVRSAAVPQAEQPSDDELEHRNDLALIIAGTYEDEAGHFTTGLEFEHRFISLVGAGAGYEFEFAERFSVSPSLEMDFIGRDHALVYGLDFGVSF
jgi:hypothetical protein